MVEEGKLKLMSSPRGYSVPTHVLYADDLLIFFQRDQKEIRELDELLE